MLRREYGSHDSVNLHLSVPPTTEVTGLHATKFELLKIDDPLERSFYEKECEEEHWGVRELKRQMKSMLFHRLALSTDKQEILKLASEG